MGKLILVFLYLFAIVLSDLFVTHFGQKGLLLTGFILIPFDLFTRDLLHDYWRNSYLKLKMLALVGCGSLISYLINNASKRVAIASMTSFAIAGFVNFLIYQILIDRSRKIKMNVANCFAAIVDSFIFPIIAFNGFDLMISMSQSGLKVFGGFMWVYLYLKTRKGAN